MRLAAQCKPLRTFMAKRKTSATSYTREIEVSGRKFTLEYNAIAYDAMFQLTGISLIKEWTPGDMGAREIGCFIFSGLLTHHEDIDLKFILASLRGDNLDVLYTDALTAYKASLPKPKDDPANPTSPIAKS
jgi:hypothetical protein